MKLLVTAILLLSSSAALAFPAIGDMATYDGLFISKSGSRVNYEMTQELTYYNPETDSFTMKITTKTVGGDTDVQEAEMPAYLMMDRRRVLEILKMCKAMGITMNRTMLAGTFMSCSNKSFLTGQTNTFWYADVPFGMIESDEFSDSGRTVKTLKAFRHGYR